jgi:hypothetical protein
MIQFTTEGSEHSAANIEHTTLAQGFPERWVAGEVWVTPILALYYFEDGFHVRE